MSNRSVSPLCSNMQWFSRVSCRLRRNPQWIFFCFLLVAVAIYFKTFGSFFVWDEQRIILNNGRNGYLSPSNAATFFRKAFFYSPSNYENEEDSYYRPVTIFLYSIQYKAFGFFYPLFHILSLLLHVLNATLVVIISAQLMKPFRPFPRISMAAVLCGFTFLIHPRNAQTVCIITNQASLLDTFFGLLSLLFWMNYLRVRSLLFGAYATVFFFLAVLCKESAYILPMLLLVTGLLWGNRAGGGTRGWLLPWCVFPMTLLALSAWKSHFVGIESQFIWNALANIPQDRLLPYLATVCQLFFVQCFGFLLPLDQPTFMLPFPCVSESWQMIFLLLLTAVTLVVFLRWAERIVLLGGLWFALLYLPYSCVVPNFQFPGITLLLSAHQVYSAMPGLILLSMYLLFSLYDRIRRRNPGRMNGIFVFFLICWMAFLLMRSFSVSERYTSAEAFYEHVLDENEKYVQAHVSYAWHLRYISGDREAAQYHLCQALEQAEKMRCFVDEEFSARELVQFYGRECLLDEAQEVLDRVRNRWMFSGREVEYHRLEGGFVRAIAKCRR
jgi:hypothetical protein